MGNLNSVFVWLHKIIYECNKILCISQEKVYVDYLEIMLYFISNFTVYINFLSTVCAYTITIIPWSLKNL